MKTENYKCFFDADNLKKISDILGTTELVMRLYCENIVKKEVKS